MSKEFNIPQAIRVDIDDKQDKQWNWKLPEHRKTDIANSSEKNYVASGVLIRVAIRKYMGKITHIEEREKEAHPAKLNIKMSSKLKDELAKRAEELNVSMAELVTECVGLLLKDVK